MHRALRWSYLLSAVEVRTTHYVLQRTIGFTPPNTGHVCTHPYTNRMIVIKDFQPRSMCFITPSFYKKKCVEYANQSTGTSTPTEIMKNTEKKG